MRNVEYITAELSLLCKEYKDVASDAANKGKAERLVEEIRKLVEELAEANTGSFNMDSVFFAGELDHHGKEYEVEYPGDRHEDADEEPENSGGTKKGGHGNTRLPYGLCEKYGIEVQKGWTPKDAWAALAGKGVSASEEYKKLKERGTTGPTGTKKVVSPERHMAAKKACEDKQAEMTAKRKELNRKINDAVSRTIDLRYGALSTAKNNLLIAEQEATKAKKRKDAIAGRTKEQIEADMNEYHRRAQEAQELNDKFYERPSRHSPERAEWDAWCEAHGGRQAILDRINHDLMDKDGARELFDRDEALFNREYDKYGPDGGLKAARKKVRDLKKECEGYEQELSKIEAEQEEYVRQREEIVHASDGARKEYYDAVKERFPSMDDCQTSADVAERLTAEGYFTGDDVMCKFSNTVPKEVALTQAKALSDFMDKVPFMKGHCHRLSIRSTKGDIFGGEDYSNVYGYSDRNEVVLNEKHFGDPETFRQSYQHDIDEGFHPPGTTAESVIHHEYSHQLDDYMTEALHLRSGNFSTMAMHEVCSKLGMTREECKAAVSGYSVKNRSGGDVEWFAEAMSEYTSSPNPRPVAVAVGEYVMECAKKLQSERHDAADDDEEGRWVTTENNHKVHINEEGVPDKGNPHVLEVMEDKKGKKPKTSAKDDYDGRIKGILNSSDDYDAKCEKMEKVLMDLPVGSRLDFPESWNETDFKSYAVHEGKGVWRYHYGRKKDESYTMPRSELAGYMMEDMDEERPGLSKVGKGLKSAVTFKTKTDTTKVLNEFLKLEDTEDYWKAMSRGLSAQDDREQFRMFAKYMHGVGYGSDGHDAFNSYVYHGDGLINGMLRGLIPKTMKQQKEWIENAEQTREHINKMTEKIDENPLRESAMVYRGIRTKSGLVKTLGLSLKNGVDIETLFDNPDFLGSLIGHTFSDPGFTSTSIDREVPARGGFDATCSMEIYCPAGTKGTYFGDALKLTDEYEFLLQRGTQFVITDADYGYTSSGKKRLKLKVAVVCQEPQEIPDPKRLYDPSERMTSARNSGETIQKQELKKMYGKLSDGALDDIVKMHDMPRSGDLIMDVDDILTEEMFVGNITPEEAGELASYTSRVGVHEKIDDYVSWNRRQLEDWEKPKQETIDSVAMEYPDLPERIRERIAVHKEYAEKLRKAAQKDIELRGEDTITSGKLKRAEEAERCIEYLLRAYNRSKGKAKQ